MCNYMIVLDLIGPHFICPCDLCRESDLNVLLKFCNAGTIQTFLTSV